MRRIILNRKYIVKLATRWTTGIFAFLGLIGTFASLSDLLDSSLSIQCRIGISIGILAGIWVISFLLCAVYTYRRRRIEVAELNNGHHIYVQYGDVFSEAEVLEPQKRRNIVIPVNRCFDTLVDNDLVSASTLHGIAMNRLYRENEFDPNTLEDAIKNNLNLQEVSYDSKYWSLSFTDAHDLMQARDNSLNCSIKASLSKRMDASRTFILIVGNNTKSVRSGSCQYCGSYKSYAYTCSRGHSLDYRSYVEYECEKAIRDGLEIIVLYNAATVNKSKCPDVIKNVGTHVAMCYYENGQYYWDYQAVKNAIG